MIKVKRPVIVDHGDIRTCCHQNGDRDTYTYYSDTGRLNTYTYTVGSVPSSTSGTLTWNVNGSLSKLAIVDGFNSTGTETCKYGDPGASVPGYDDLGRLTKVDCGAVWSQTFSYDQYGNITKSGSVAWMPGYDARNRYTLAGTSYDADGNLLNDSFHSYIWDVYGHPSVMTSPNASTSCGTSGVTCITYDALGRVVEKSLGSAYTEIEYAPIGKVAVMNGHSTQTQSYVPLPGGAIFSGSDTLWHSDWLGSIRLASSLSNRTIVFDRAFAPFGEMYNTVTGGTSNPNFAGMTRDTISDEGDTPNREFHQKQGRWISPDPGGFNSINLENPQSWNRYSYVNNTPLTMNDPTGLCGGDVSQGSAGGGGWVAIIGILGDDFLAIGPMIGLPFNQGTGFTVDGFSASSEEALQLVAADIGTPGLKNSVTVPENVIFDQNANQGQGLTCEQVCKYKDMQKEMEEFFKQIGIQFKVTYTEGHIVYLTGGTINDVIGKAQKQLNVFVTNSVPVILNQAFGNGKEATKFMLLDHGKYAFTFIGLTEGADTHSLEHGFTHHFLGNTLGKGGVIQNTFIDFYIDDIVLPHITRYGEEMRGYSQQVLSQQ